MDESYTVFTHIEDPGALWAQKDAVPVCNLAPTYTWHPGQVVVDRHEMVLDPATPPGEHALTVGVYRASDLEHLMARGSGGQQMGVRIELARITVANG
jgi:hypothetical protein